ncbi:MAG: hypothetical protein V4534_06485 [Myxococcota bacterium]
MRGTSLIAAVVAIGIIGTMSMGLPVLVSENQALRTGQLQNTQAYYSSRAGLEFAKRQLFLDAVLSTIPARQFVGTSWTFTRTAGTVRAAGTYGNSTDTFSYSGDVIFLVASATSTSTGTTSLVVNVPTGTQNGDTMLAAVTARTNAVTFTTPAGWTLVLTQTQTSANTGVIRIYRKTASGSEPASYTFTLNSNQDVVAGILTFRNANATNPIDASASAATASATAQAAPTVTTTVTDTMIVTFHGINRGTTFTAPTGMTEIFDIRSDATTNGITLLASMVPKPTTGASGTKTATAAAAQRGQTVTVALEQ